MKIKSYYIATLSVIKEHGPKFYTYHGLPLDHPAEVSKDQSEFIWIVEAEDSAHMALEQDERVTVLASPMSLKPLDEAHVEKLKNFGVKSGHHTMDLSNILFKIMPTMRHSRF